MNVEQNIANDEPSIVQKESHDFLHEKKIKSCRDVFLRGLHTRDNSFSAHNVHIKRHAMVTISAMFELYALFDISIYST